MGFPKVKITKEKVSKGKFSLEIGDVVETKNLTYLVVCDGYGRYYFLELRNPLYIYAQYSNLYSIKYNNEFQIGDKLIEDLADSEITNVYSADKVKIEIKLED